MNTVVIGVGNPLMGDDGIGLEALRRLETRWTLPKGLETMDGGTWGMNLLHLMEEADGVILLDAIRSGQAPGTRVRLDRDDLPRMFVHKISPHQIDLQEVLALADLRGGLPERMVALGVEPARIELGVGLSSVVMDSMEALEEDLVGLLGDWGYRLELRTDDTPPAFTGEWVPVRPAASAEFPDPVI